MPVRPPKKKKPAKKSAGAVKGIRLKETGLTTRTRGHVSARGKRAQARRDSK